MYNDTSILIEKTLLLNRFGENIMTKSEMKKLALFTITWPIFIETFLHMAMRTVDTFMVSSISDEAVASVGIANQIVMFLFFMFNFIATGAAIVIAQYLGAKKYNEISRYVGNAIVINLVFGLAVSALIVIFNKPLLSIFQLEAELMADASIFLYIVGGGLFLQALILTLSATIQTHGFTRDTMLVTLGMNLLNITGNYLFIYGALGVPQLGVTGVAISTIITHVLGLIVYFMILRRRVKVILEWKDFVDLKWERVQKILRIGVPGGIGHLSYSGSQIVTTALITLLGATMLATRIYTQNIMFFIMILAVSLGRGTQIITGRLIGAGEMQEAYRRALRNVKLSVVLAFVMAGVIAIFSKPLLQLFTDDPVIIQVGATLLVLSLLLETGRCSNIVLGQSLQAAGDARYLMLVSIIVIWTFSVPMYYLLGIHLGYGLLGIWVAFIADEWLRGIIIYFRWRSRKWESKALIKHEAKKEEVTA